MDRRRLEEEEEERPVLEEVRKQAGALECCARRPVEAEIVGRPVSEVETSPEWCVFPLRFFSWILA